MPSHQTPGRIRSIFLGAALLGSILLPAHTEAVAATAPTIEQLIGQKLMVAMRGTTPSLGILRRVRRGEVGGIILFSSNIRSASQLASLTGKLQDAAAAGGQPPLLISTDQEGGAVKRVPWAPPTLSPPQMGAIGDASVARAQGRGTGRMLSCGGINQNLAPVADVPGSTDSFMYQQGRTWSFNAGVTARLSDSFARGLRGAGDVATMKHFPGIGLAVQNTDLNDVLIRASADRLAPGLRPYRRAIDDGLQTVMLSNARYTAYDRRNAAGWSHAVSIGLLRETLGFTGVSITDSLSGTAAARGVSATSLALKAARAGTDMILLTGPESSTQATYAKLVQAAANGTISRSRLRDSYDRILALKAGLVPVSDTEAPLVRAPGSRLLAPSMLGSTTTSVGTSWSAEDPCGIYRYGLQRQVDAGIWADQPLPGLASTSVQQALRFGSTYRYRVRATDGAGNTSAWRIGRAFVPRKDEESRPSITYDGPWQNVMDDNASGGSLATTTARGAAARFSVTGYAVGWVAATGPHYGKAKVYVDGTYRTSVNLYSARRHAQQVVFTARWPGNGTHRLRIVNVATDGHPRIAVDAFVFLRKLS